MIETIKKRKNLAVMAEYSVNPPFPREIFIDLTSFCNHSCVFCSNSKLKQRHTMKPDMVKRVLQEAYENGTRDAGIYVTMVYTDSTEQEIDLIRELVQPYIDEWDPHLLTNQCGNKFDNNELGNIEEFNIRGRSKSDICFQPFKGFTVTPEGYVSACVLDYQKYLIVGDLNKTTLKEIWTNKIYTLFRERHIENNIKGLICYNCINNTDENITPLMPEYTETFQS